MDWIYSTKRTATQSYGCNLQRLQQSRNNNNSLQRHSVITYLRHFWKVASSRSKMHVSIFCWHRLSYKYALWKFWPPCYSTNKCIIFFIFLCIVISPYEQYNNYLVTWRHSAPNLQHHWHSVTEAYLSCLNVSIQTKSAADVVSQWHRKKFICSLTYKLCFSEEIK